MTSAQPKDYYAILGIAFDATAREVKAAYRKLAKQHHPDASPGDPDAAARFRDITEACETLSDPGRRKAYDRTRTPPGMPVTHPGEGALLSVLLGVLEETWREIRHRHPEVPPVVVIIASGTETRQAKWGHYASGRWYADNIKHAEVMIGGEGLRREPVQVLAILLHEAAHALAACRGIGDTSRQGRYHNKKYALLARELGLEVAEDTQFGWTVTTVPDATAARYETQLAHLKAAMTMWRGDEQHARTAKRDTNLVAASCPCGRKIRVAASTLKEAPIQCQACDGTFEPASTL